MGSTSKLLYITYMFHRTLVFLWLSFSAAASLFLQVSNLPAISLSVKFDLLFASNIRLMNF